LFVVKVFVPVCFLSIYPERSHASVFSGFVNALRHIFKERHETYTEERREKAEGRKERGKERVMNRKQLSGERREKRES